MSSYLADTSAWSIAQRKRAPGAMRARFAALLTEDAVAICAMVEWELLHSTNNATEFATRRRQLGALRQCPIEPRHWRRALDVCQALARDGGSLHRSIKVQDALIAAAAETAELIILHYDRDFDTIAGVTGQPTEWIAPRGSV